MALHWSKLAKIVLGVTSIVHVFGCYFFLQWIPGRPIFLALVAFFIVNICLSWLLLMRKVNIKDPDEIEKEVKKPQVKTESLKGDIRRRKVGSPIQTAENEIEGSSQEVSKPKKKHRTSYILKINLAFQIILSVLALDFTFTSWVRDSYEELTYSRVTWVNDTSVHIFSRFPKQTQIKIEYKSSLAEKWNYFDFQNAGAESDYTYIVKLDGLEPSTKYEYRFAEAQVVQGSVKELLPKPLSGEEIYRFTTSPIPFSRTKLYFGAGSCIKPDFPYTPLVNKGIRGFKALNHFDFQYLLFLGDFIYADTPFYFGPSVGSYRRFYRQIYADADVRSFAEKIPILHAYDDHEILNNWDKNETFPFENAMTAYSEYQGYGPYLTSEDENSYYSMTHGDIGFFFWDTRRFRSNGAEVDSPEKTMLGKTQKESFKKWIHDTKDSIRVRFIVSSVPLTYNWVIADAAQDTWKGYKHERQELLEFLAPIPNVFFLSGDRHEVAIVNLPFNKIEFSLSPINQFFGPIQTFKPDGSAPEFDPTVLYYRHGNIKFGGFFIDTQSRADGRPLIAVSVYSDMPGNFHDNHFDPKVIAPDSPHSFSNLKVPLASIKAKVVTNFDFSAETALEDYLESHLYSGVFNPLVEPVMHLFWLGE
ncbi:hypothetical protein DSO57_1025011 [Entomophthora muscae]|uniref:Uncharacterized protein n=1 Tax=Entomophthora muscae TaxID=34485 RepID=A0ACC2TDL3_9FUNG|nr:hypothetical protein DSO57_1025011 [Entomophthora muscae]